MPTLVNFSGTLTDATGKPVTGTSGVTFYLYEEQQGGSPLWMETQNVQPDKNGHYTVALGAGKSEGLPLNLFAWGRRAGWECRHKGRRSSRGCCCSACPTH